MMIYIERIKRFQQVLNQSRARILVSFMLLCISSLNVYAKDPLPVKVKQQLLMGEFKQAAAELRILAAKNHAEAQYQLAILYLNGKGVSRSVDKAEAALISAAETSADAAFLLGSLYLKGKQLTSSPEKAKKYLKISAQAGIARAERMLQQLAKKQQGNRNIKVHTQRAFSLAVNSGALSEVIKHYLQGANLNYPDDRGDPPLIAAIRYGCRSFASTK